MYINCIDPEFWDEIKDRVSAWLHNSNNYFSVSIDTFSNPNAVALDVVVSVKVRSYG